MSKLYTTFRTRLILTSDQESLFWKFAGVARWSYNYFLSENQKSYKDTGRGISVGELLKTIKNLKKTTHPWLAEVSNKVIQQGIKDAGNALDRFFKKVSGYPKFRSKHKSIPGFYVRYESLKRLPNGFIGEKLGFVRSAYPLPKLSKGKHYINPRIKYDGKHWYLTISYEIDPIDTNLTDNVIGIDLGIKSLTTLSDGTVYKNINKTREVKRLNKKLRREQRRLSRKIEDKIDHYSDSRKPIYVRPLKDYKNITKQSFRVRLLYRRISNIHNNYIHTITSQIVKTKPSRVVMEDLNVQGMMKNKHLSRSVQDQKFYTFRVFMKYKCERYGIEFRVVPRFYASSKICSHCGHKKNDLRLSDRTYICDECGLVIDRDLNAAINLMNYQF